MFRNSVLIIARVRGNVKWFIHHSSGRFSGKARRDLEGIETPRSPRGKGVDHEG
jgi:hypothetical protein